MSLPTTKFSRISALSLVCVLFVLPVVLSELKEDVWQQDLSDSFKIDPSTEGLQKLHLKCGAESMHIELETESDFTGVMYTRGSFYKQNGPCFVRPERVGRTLKMSFGLDQCQTVKGDEEVYSNIVIVQHEPDLVMPGDAAFAVECDYRSPRSVTLEADLQTRDRTAVGSRITLTSPDPGAAAHTDKPNAWDTVHSDGEEVAFVPGQVDTARTIKNKEGADQKVRGTVEDIRVEL